MVLGKLILGKTLDNLAKVLSLCSMDVFRHCYIAACEQHHDEDSPSNYYHGPRPNDSGTGSKVAPKARQ